MARRKPVPRISISSSGHIRQNIDRHCWPASSRSPRDASCADPPRRPPHRCSKACAAASVRASLAHLGIPWPATREAPPPKTCPPAPKTRITSDRSCNPRKQNRQSGTHHIVYSDYENTRVPILPSYVRKTLAGAAIFARPGSFNMRRNLLLQQKLPRGGFCGSRHTVAVEHQRSGSPRQGHISTRHWENRPDATARTPHC